ncbi:class I SAM-dependent methyltransferase [Aurantiacibacter poecillastricola]|uniref:class I SAM-dependent methyltransferase n=1 Tax=Aurantiacibacter poecillastricola TaxID=3064385 RepID=UPI00273DAAE4|nr:class I SAM-dependent methyltransferase [Aurantiacibacter sp. 219JJ12-13]MDP5261809.1 class I SAM-dependent methyltransferase [Aurantiacibacter sp. 219JJ12-13]
MPDNSVHEAWNVFWERETRSGKAASGQTPENWQSIDRAQAAAWQAFAKALPKGARVLDVATGDGRAMAHLLQTRRDLKIMGVDRAVKLPKPPRGAKMRGGVAMEDLPFAAAQFTCVTSQFGFEYSDIEKSAEAIARVLRPGGRFAMISHRSDGPIVAHNRKRRAQIAWVLEEQDLLALARNSLRLRSAGIAAIPPAIIAAPEQGAAMFGSQSAAWEIAEAIRQTLHMGRRDDPARVAAILDDIGQQAENELGRIASLEIAATTASGGSMLQVLEGVGFILKEEAPLTAAFAPEPFADFRVFQLPG